MAAGCFHKDISDCNNRGGGGVECTAIRNKLKNFD